MPLAGLHTVIVSGCQHQHLSIKKFIQHKLVKFCVYTYDEMVFRCWQWYVNTTPDVQCIFAVCVHTSGSHCGKGDIYRAAAVWRGLHLPAEEEGGGSGAAASSRHPHQEPNSVAELCALTDLLCALGQRWRPFTGSYIISPPFVLQTEGVRTTCLCTESTGLVTFIIPSFC